MLYLHTQRCDGANEGADSSKSQEASCRKHVGFLYSPTFGQAVVTQWHQTTAIPLGDCHKDLHHSVFPLETKA
jgi:hypothetical protein